MDTAELRIVALEEAGFFQEKRLGELDKALVSQQAQIDKLERQVEEMRKQIAALREDADVKGPANEPPPHYNQEKWKGRT